MRGRPLIYRPYGCGYCGYWWGAPLINPYPGCTADLF